MNDEQINRNLGEVSETLKKSFGQKFCSVPDDMKKNCKGKVIKAHTISKCLGLKDIAKEGEVYGFGHLDFHATYRTNKQAEIKFTKIGIQKASVLNVFCEKHDREIFSNIENTNFIVTEEQCFLLAYRSFIGEWYKTICSPVPDLIDREYESLKERISPFLVTDCGSQEKIIDFLKGDDPFQQGLFYKKRDLEIDKQTFDEVLSNKNFSRVQHYIFEGNKTSNVLCSFTLNPDRSFDNEIIQNYEDPQYMSSIYVSSITKNNRGFVIFSWINEEQNSKIIEKFWGSLLSKTNDIIENNILEFIFKSCENTYFSINWYDSLNRTQHKYLTCWAQPLSNHILTNTDHKIRFMELQKHYLLNSENR